MGNIGYKVGGQFIDEWHDGRDIGFDILFPFVYDTERDAEDFGAFQTSAVMEKCETGEVVIHLYEFEKLVDTIRWEEWWKYRCYRLKEDCKDKMWLAGNRDFEPFAERFETIFDGYAKEPDEPVKFTMRFLSYWVELVPRKKNRGHKERH